MNLISISAVTVLYLPGIKIIYGIQFLSHYHSYIESISRFGSVYMLLFFISNSTNSRNSITDIETKRITPNIKKNTHMYVEYRYSNLNENRNQKMTENKIQFERRMEIAVPFFSSLHRCFHKEIQSCNHLDHQLIQCMNFNGKLNQVNQTKQNWIAVNRWKKSDAKRILDWCSFFGLVLCYEWALKHACHTKRYYAVPDSFASHVHWSIDHMNISQFICKRLIKITKKTHNWNAEKKAASEQRLKPKRSE